MEFKDAVEMLEDGISVTVKAGGYDYEVGPAEDFLGGGEGYISVALGNVLYDSAEDVLRETIKYLEGEGEKVRIQG